MSLEDGFDSADSWMLNDNGQAYTYPDGSSADDWMLANNGGGGTFQSSDYANLFGDNGGGTLNLGGLGGLLGGMFGSGNTTSNGTDYTRLLGALGAAGLGAYSANQQSNAYSDLANKYMSFGAPYREKLAGLYTPGGIDAYLKSADVTAPVQQGTDALARALSVHGNPAGQGFALQSLQDYATNTLSGKLGEERSRLGGFGGLSAFNGAAPGMSGASINAQAGVPNAIGWGLQNTLNPQTSMNDILMQMAKNQQQPGLT